MSWHAKPSGKYEISSTEGTENIWAAYAELKNRGYTKAAIAGILGNVRHGAGLNPWRWQSDTVTEGYTNGYGLFQYTPASHYITDGASYDFYAPNLSTTETTLGAQATDAIAQIAIMDDNAFKKWLPGCWRSYWDKDDYQDLYNYTRIILTQWGTDDKLSMAQFRTITDVAQACVAFMACFEGPGVPNWEIRVLYANSIYDVLNSEKPVVKKRKMPIMYYLKPNFFL